MAAWLAFSSSPMVTRAGLSMEALSWNATQAVSSATIKAVMLPGLLRTFVAVALMRLPRQCERVRR